MKFGCFLLASIALFPAPALADWRSGPVTHSIDPGNNVGFVMECKAGETVRAGGYQLERFPPNSVFIQSNVPDAQRRAWVVNIQNVGPKASSFTAYIFAWCEAMVPPPPPAP